MYQVRGKIEVVTGGRSILGQMRVRRRLRFCGERNLLGTLLGLFWILFQQPDALSGLFWNSPGLSWLPLGLSQATLRLPRAALGRLLVPLRPPFVKPLGPRGSTTAAKCPKTVPKVAQDTKREPKLTSKE